MRWRIKTVLAGVVVAAILPLAAAPASAQAETDTRTEKGIVETFVDEIPCLGLAEITTTSNLVEHFSTDAQGGTHFTFTQTGTATATLLATGETLTARFTIWGGGNFSADGTRATSTFTFRGNVVSESGVRTKWNSVSHFTGPVDAEGNPILDAVRVSFDNLNCH